MEPMNTASPEIKRVIKRILRLESEKLYQQKPHVISDLVKIIKEEVQ